MCVPLLAADGVGDLLEDSATNTAVVIDDNVDAVAIEVEATEVVDDSEDGTRQDDDALLVPVLAEAVAPSAAENGSDVSEPATNPVVKKLTYAGIGVGIGSILVLVSAVSSEFSMCQCLVVALSLRFGLTLVLAFFSCLFGMLKLGVWGLGSGRGRRPSA